MRDCCFENRGRPWPREREGPATKSWEGFSFQNNNCALCNFNNEVVLLSLLGKYLLTVDKRLATNLSINVSYLLLVDADTICLNHLAALSL